MKTTVETFPKRRHNFFWSIYYAFLALMGQFHGILSRKQHLKARDALQSFPDLDRLPPELAVAVLSNLNATDLCLAACVWDHLANNNLLWMRYSNVTIQIHVLKFSLKLIIRCTKNWTFMNTCWRTSGISESICCQKVQEMFLLKNCLGSNTSNHILGTIFVILEALLRSFVYFIFFIYHFFEFYFLFLSIWK